MEIFQDPMYNTTRQETYEFWRTMAIRYQGNHTVVFFELFNEPTIADGKMGSASWSEWKKINENMIHIIRAYDKEKIPLVAGFDWAYDLTPLHLEPIDAEGIGYTTHPYQEKRHRPFEAKWEEDFGFAANWYPVVATEFGFSTEWRNAEESRAYAKEIIAYLEAKHISWIVWVYDPEWGPRLIESWSTFKPTESGEFFSGAMHVNVR
jgi:aryl-phospho-beta-D-glucosidase BglC (GH1 family)